MANGGIHEVTRSGRLQRKSTRLKNQLTDDLTEGLLSPGALMPSENSLAERFGVSRPTVRQALAEMEQEGLIRREQSRGTFVSDDARQRLRKTTGSYALLAVGVNEFGTLPLIRGFEQACKAAHRTMTIYNSENDFNQQGELILRLLSQGVSGVAMQPVLTQPTPPYHVTMFQDRGIPVVLCHRGVQGVRAPVLLCPHEEEGRLIGRIMTEYGHRRIAMVSVDSTSEVTGKLKRGLCEAMSKGGGELPVEFDHGVQTPSLDYRSEEKNLVIALKKMLDAPDPPTAIWAAPDGLAQTAYFALQRLGLRIPEDISLVGQGDADRSGSFLGRLTSVVVDTAEIGRRASELLAEMESGERSLHDANVFQMPVTLSEGETLGPAAETLVLRKGN